MSSHAKRRVLNELKKIEAMNEIQIGACPDQDQIMIWDAFIEGY